MVSGIPASKAAVRLPASPTDNTTKPSAAGSCSVSTTSIFLLILLLNSCAAIYQSQDDPWSVAFVVASFTIMVLLFHLTHRFEAAPPGSPARKPIKIGVWSLTSALTVMFSYKIAALMPVAAAIAVWSMGASTVLAGFYMLFLIRGEEQEQQQANGDDDEPLKAAEDGVNKQRTSSAAGIPDLHKPILSS